MSRPYQTTRSFAQTLILALLITSVSPFASHTSARGGLAQDPAKANEVVIPDGTEFTVVTTEEITSKTATEGDPLAFKVAEDVVVDGHIVIAKDTLVKGVVANAKKAGMMGRGGSLGIRIETTTTSDNQKLKLRSSKGKDGEDKTGTTVALVVLFGPLGFLKHGKNAKIKSGTQIKVYTNEEKRFRSKRSKTNSKGLSDLINYHQLLLDPFCANQWRDCQHNQRLGQEPLLGAFALIGWALYLS